MNFIYNDGGRSNYFKATNVGDCVTRAICNATGKDYKEVYDRLKELAKKESVKRHRGHKQSSVRDGVFKETWKKYLKEIGWVRVSTIKKGCSDRMHLTEEEIPNGVLILELPRHLTCVKDKTIYDTYDCSIKQYYDEFGDLITNTERIIYGYWRAPLPEEIKIQKQERSKKEEAKELKENKAEQKKKIRYEYLLKISKLQREIKKLEKQRDLELALI